MGQVLNSLLSQWAAHSNVLQNAYAQKANTELAKGQAAAQTIQGVSNALGGAIMESEKMAAATNETNAQINAQQEQWAQKESELDDLKATDTLLKAGMNPNDKNFDTQKAELSTKMKQERRDSLTKLPTNQVGIGGSIISGVKGLFGGADNPLKRE